jgi:cytidylate kinase
MASVVFPDAALKVFLTASAEARAMRRYKQLIEKGVSANLSNLTRDLQERDRRDRERPVSPCVPAPDALVLDSSDLSIEATVGQVLSWWQARVR